MTLASETPRDNQSDISYLIFPIILAPKSSNIIDNLDSFCGILYIHVDTEFANNDITKKTEDKKYKRFSTTYSEPFVVWSIDHARAKKSYIGYQ